MAHASDPGRDSILIIEKDPHIAYLLDYMLSREGFNVICTTNCASALLLMRKMLSPCVVFLDIELSREHENDFLKSLRGMPGWQSTPVILLTEQYGYEHIDPALAAGATDYIVQPFNPAELLVQIQRHKLHS